MAWAYEQKFNALNTATLDGQDSWNVTGGTQLVGNYTPYEGAKSLSVGASSTSHRDISDVSSGIVYFAIRASGFPTADFFAIRLHNNTVNRSFYIGFRAGIIKLLENEGDAFKTLEASPAINTWYPLAVEFDGANHKARAKIYSGGSWSAWSDWLAHDIGSGFDKIDRIIIIENDSNTTGGVIDTISPTDPTIPIAKPRSQGTII